MYVTRSGVSRTNFRLPAEATTMWEMCFVDQGEPLVSIACALSSQPELEGNRSKPQRRRLLKFWGVLPTKGGAEVRKGPLPPFPFPCEGLFPQHYKYSAGGALPGLG
jgi:hypothetical protein